MLKALGVAKCEDILHKRALLAAVLTPVQLSFFLEAALGLGATRHEPPPGEGEVGRKGMSCERTFR